MTFKIGQMVICVHDGNNCSQGMIGTVVSGPGVFGPFDNNAPGFPPYIKGYLVKFADGERACGTLCIRPIDDPGFPEFEYTAEELHA